VIKNQRGVLLYLARKVGVNLLTGKSIMNVSLPIKIFEPRSMLEKIGSDFRFVSYYLGKMMEVEDPIERMKIAVTWYIASLQIEPQMLKPFNPILGETFQGTIGEYEIALEQISHHPPISGIQIWSETVPNSPKINGHFQHEAHTGISAITGYKNGYLDIEFPDGYKLTFTEFPG
jgi:hypothetical protein